MMCSVRGILRFALLLSAIIACGSIQSDSSAISSSALCGAPIEVRIRKLHLVRPDLIHYPLALEIIC